MALPLKDRVKLDSIIQRIQTNRFDANDVDNLLMRLRAAGRGSPIFQEVANFVAHNDARDRGLSLESITAIVDSIRYFREYISDGKPLYLDAPFPSYVYRLLLSQAGMADEGRLRAEYRMSRITLRKKIEANFSLDRATGTCTLRNNKGGVELLAALRFIMGFIHSRPAFHIRDFHRELKGVLRAQKVPFDEAAWDVQENRISLAILCLVSNTEFKLPDESRATCALATTHHHRILSGQRRLPTGAMTSEPASFGSLTILGRATIHCVDKLPLKVGFPLIDTDLDPHEHCDQNLFIRGRDIGDFADCEVEILNLAPDMSLSNAFKLIRTDSLMN